MINARYFPCLPEYKAPVGGVKINENFRIFLACKEGEKAFFVLKKRGEGHNAVYYPMEKQADGYRVEMSVTSEGIYYYHFEVELKGKRYGVYSDRSLNSVGTGEEWQLTAYAERYAAPAFLEGGVFYQIMVDRFNIGKKRIKSKENMLYREDWGGIPYYERNSEGNIDNTDMFGGNLYGVIDKLSYLKSLGVKCIYLNPIFESQSNHKYDTSSYRRVDSDFGGDEALDLLIRKAEKKGIKIILDGVFSHTGSDSVYFNKKGRYDSVGAYQSKDSPYYEWFKFINYPDKYDCWWGVKILPCTDENNPSFDEFINGEDGIIRSYMRKGIAGWRLDVADELPDKFLSNLTRAVKAERADGMVLGEVWEDASNKVAYGVEREYLCGSQLDSVTNYPFKNAIIDFVKSGDAESLRDTVNTLVNNYPQRVLNNLMNCLSTHDTVRVLTALSKDELPTDMKKQAEFRISDRESALKRLRLALILQYTLPGVPCIYYGDEAGMEGGQDPLNRVCYPWSKEDGELIAYYKSLAKLRRKAPINYGDIVINGAKKGVIDFTRGGKIRVIVNAGDKEISIGKRVKNILSGEYQTVIPPLSAVVFR